MHDFIDDSEAEALKSSKTPLDPVQLALLKLHEIRENTFKRLQESAYAAAEKLVTSVEFEADDELALKNRKLQLDAADKVLGYAGYAPQPQAPSVTISITAPQADRISKAVSLLGEGSK
jgi:hypothetical protein